MGIKFQLKKRLTRAKTGKKVFVLEGIMNRDSSIPMNTETYTHGTTMGFSFELGAQGILIGDTNNLYKSGKFIAGFSFQLFPWYN